MNDFTNRGSLWPNDRKETERHPDFTGVLNVEGKEYRVAAWNKNPDASENTPALSFSVQPKVAAPEQEQPLAAEDDIPF